MNELQRKMVNLNKLIENISFQNNRKINRNFLFRRKCEWNNSTEIIRSPRGEWNNSTETIRSPRGEWNNSTEIIRSPRGEWNNS
ncbi:MAG: hypothetical protein LBG80_11405, partial [Bacteroidales bacterium]|nr:hypothetical protein [Bacteroidales bacterium]